jgi:hypothetical protein
MIVGIIVARAAKANLWFATLTLTLSLRERGLSYRPSERLPSFKYFFLLKESHGNYFDAI